MAAAIGRKLATFGFGAATGSVATHYLKSFYQSTADEDLPPPDVEPASPSTSSVTNVHHPRKPTRSWNFEHYRPTHPWNYDWDNRAHDMTVKSEDGGEQSQPVKRTKAIRHLFLIRHGQYNLKGETDQVSVLFSTSYPICLNKFSKFLAFRVIYLVLVFICPLVIKRTLSEINRYRILDSSLYLLVKTRRKNTFILENKV
jgi:hypothetical protein